MLESSVFPKTFLFDTAMHISPDKQCIEAGQYAEAVLRNFASPQLAGEMWKEANLNWNMFLPSADIDPFIQKHVSNRQDFSMGYLFGPIFPPNFNKCREIYKKPKNIKRITFQKLEFTLNDISSNTFVPCGKSPEEIENILRGLLQMSQPTKNSVIMDWICVSYINLVKQARESSQGSFYFVICLHNEKSIRFYFSELFERDYRISRWGAR